MKDELDAWRAFTKNVQTAALHNNINAMKTAETEYWNTWKKQGPLKNWYDERAEYPLIKGWR